MACSIRPLPPVKNDGRITCLGVRRSRVSQSEGEDDETQRIKQQEERS